MLFNMRKLRLMQIASLHLQMSSKLRSQCFGMYFYGISNVRFWAEADIRGK